MADILEFNKKTCASCEMAVFVKEGAGACHRNPPVPVVFMQRNTIGEVMPVIQPVFPPVFRTDWCAEWRSSRV